jgi:hypothetical protein
MRRAITQGSNPLPDPSQYGLGKDRRCVGVQSFGCQCCDDVRGFHPHATHPELFDQAVNAGAHSWVGKHPAHVTSRAHPFDVSVLHGSRAHSGPMPDDVQPGGDMGVKFQTVQGRS